MEKEQLKILGQKEFDKDAELYKVIDFLNKSLKQKGLIFGVTRKNSKMTVSIYEE